MASSLSYRLTLSPDLFPARTPGPLGRFDAADPSVIAEIGDTPGPLGLNDHGGPDVQRYYLIPTFRELDDFEDAVLQAHVARAQRRSGHGPLVGIPESEHGPHAVALTVAYVGKRKAAPGFSNAHKSEYRVHRIDTEAWHWEFELDKDILWDGATLPTTRYA